MININNNIYLTIIEILKEVTLHLERLEQKTQILSQQIENINQFSSNTNEVLGLHNNLLKQLESKFLAFQFKIAELCFDND